MNTKFRLFKLTFIILSIMFCILLASTSIIYGITVLSQNTADAASQGSTRVSGSTAAADSSAQPAQDTAAPSSNTVNNDSGQSTDSTAGSSTDTGSSQGSTGTAGTGQQNPAQTDSTYPSITISAVGDLMTHQGNLNNAYNPKTQTYDFSGFLQYIKPYISQSDLTIGNFETVTAGADYGFTSFPRFNTPDSILSALSSAGFDVLSTANNHSLDQGITGLLKTIQKIKENKIVNVGSSADGKNKYITKEINGIKVSILSYTYSFNGHDSQLTASQKTKYLNPIAEAQIKKDIDTVKSNGTDAVIVVMHWGTEYQREPNKYQTDLSKKILNWGADIILGSHPHVIQKSEVVKVNGKNKFVIYSMGNFISGYRRSDKANRPNKVFTEDGIVVQLKLEKDPKGGVIIKKLDYTPTWIDKYYVNNRPVYKIIPIPAPNPTGSYISDYNRAFIKQSYKNTMSIMAKLK